MEALRYERALVEILNRAGVRTLDSQIIKYKGTDPLGLASSDIYDSECGDKLVIVAAKYAILALKEKNKDLVSEETFEKLKNLDNKEDALNLLETLIKGLK